MVDPNYNNLIASLLGNYYPSSVLPPASNPAITTSQILNQASHASQMTALPGNAQNAYVQGYLAEKARQEKSKNAVTSDSENTEENSDASNADAKGDGLNPTTLALVIGVVVGLMSKNKNNNGGSDGLNETRSNPTPPSTDLSNAPLSEKEKQELAQGEAEINKFRAENGKPPIKLNIDQCMKAKGWSEKMANEVGMVHSNFGLRENIAMGAGILGTIRMWINSPGHRANLLASKGEIGLGKSSHGNYWTMIDGKDTGNTLDGASDWSNYV